MRIERDRPIVRVGETVTYSIFAANAGPAACDVTGISINVLLPGPDGNPGGAPVVIATGLNLPGGSVERQVGSVPVQLKVNAGVTDAIAQGTATGVLHDAPVNHAANITKTLGTTVIVNPGINVVKTGSITSGVAPQNVTYTFSVTNVSVPPVPLDNVTVADSLCPGVTGPAAGGDANGDKRLDPDETWVYTCTMTHPTAGQYDNTVTACAELILNGKTDKVCDTDTWSVTLTSPPLAAPQPVPQVAVKPVSVNQAPCTMARVNSTTVRAGQLNTIRVRVRNVDAGTTVKLTLPGSKKAITAKTDKNGLATFKVRPTKTGTAKIEAAECSDVERLSIKPARKVVSQAKPRVTG